MQAVEMRYDVVYSFNKYNTHSDSKYHDKQMETFTLTTTTAKTKFHVGFDTTKERKK